MMDMIMMMKVINDNGDDDVSGETEYGQGFQATQWARNC